MQVRARRDRRGGRRISRPTSSTTATRSTATGVIGEEILDSSMAHRRCVHLRRRRRLFRRRHGSVAGPLAGDVARDRRTGRVGRHRRPARRDASDRGRRRRVRPAAPHARHLRPHGRRLHRRRVRHGPTAATTEGVWTGPSGGANILAAVRLARELGPWARVVTVQPDSGLKYLASDLSSRTPTDLLPPAGHGAHDPFPLPFSTRFKRRLPGADEEP